MTNGERGGGDGGRNGATEIEDGCLKGIGGGEVQEVKEEKIETMSNRASEQRLLCYTSTTEMRKHSKAAWRQGR